MSRSLIVSEKYSRYWPAIAVGSALLSVAFLISYIVVSDVLIGSYLRLFAFAFFVVAFFSLFKLKDGQIKINFDMENGSSDNLEVLYSVRDRNIHEELIDLSDITKLKVDQMPNRSLYNDFNKVDRAVRFQKKHMDGWLYLNEIHGRVIPLSLENAEKIVSWIEKRRTKRKK